MKDGIRNWTKKQLIESRKDVNTGEDDSRMIINKLLSIETHRHTLSFIPQCEFVKWSKDRADEAVLRRCGECRHLRAGLAFHNQPSQPSVFRNAQCVSFWNLHKPRPIFKRVHTSIHSQSYDIPTDTSRLQFWLLQWPSDLAKYMHTWAQWCSYNVYLNSVFIYVRTSFHPRSATTKFRVAVAERRRLYGLIKIAKATACSAVGKGLPTCPAILHCFKPAKFYPKLLKEPGSLNLRG